MNPSTHGSSLSARQLPEAKQGRVPLTDYPDKIRDRNGLGVAQAVDLAKTACASALCMNSCAMDICRHFFWYPLGLEYWFEAANRAFATSMDLGNQLLGLPPSAEATSCACIKHNPDPTPEELAEMEEEIEAMEHGMDVAVEAFEEEILA